MNNVNKLFLPFQVFKQPQQRLKAHRKLRVKILCVVPVTVVLVMSVCCFGESGVYPGSLCVCCRAVDLAFFNVAEC